MTFSRRVVIATAGVLTAGLVAVGAIAFAGGFDRTTTDHLTGAGTKIAQVRLVDAALGFDVTPDVVTVQPGTRLILDVVNAGDDPHDLAIEGGALRSRMLDPGESQRLRLGRITRDVEGWCTLPGHKLLGMTVDIRVTAADHPPARGQ